MALEGAAFSGALELKLGNADWERRFFVLMAASGDLLCLPGEDSTFRDAEGVINVREMEHLGQSGGLGFEIVALDEQGQRQRYFLRANSAHQSQAWLQRIQESCAKYGVKISVGESSLPELDERPAAATSKEHGISSTALNKYDKERIQCQCYFPSGDTSVVMFVQGSDLVRDVRDRLFMNCDEAEEGHLASEYTLRLGSLGIYLDASEACKSRMCDSTFVQSCIDEKKPLVVHLVLDPAVSGEPPAPVSPVTQKAEAKLKFEEISHQKPEFYAKLSSPLLRRTYLHVHVKECWFKDGVFEESDEMLYMNVIGSLYHGSQRLATNLELSTTFVAQSINPQWNEILTFPILLFDLPEVASLNFAVYSGHQRDCQLISKLVGWANYRFIDDYGTVDSKVKHLRLWKDPPYYTCGTVPENISEDYIAILVVSLDECFYPFSLTMREDEDEGQAMFTSTLEDPELFVSRRLTNFSDDCDLLPSTEEKKHIALCVDSYDVFSVPSEPQKSILWRYRYSIKNNPRALSRFLQSVPWQKYIYAMEARRLLAKWEPLDPYTALQLLGPQFGDPAVRNYAVSVLENLSNEEICSFLVQLVQALQYEPRIESALLQFLVNKASVDQSLGYYLYWHIKAGLEVAFFAVKLQFAMNEFRKTCKSHVMTALSKQEKLVLSLANIARGIRQVKQKAERQKQLISLLSELESFESVALPVDPRCEVNGLELTKCKYMDSKKLPLWLVFKNTDRSVEEHTYIIFKTGDDLRQDILTLEMFSLMNKTWLRHNLDMKMTIYSCVATGDSSGMLQVVRNSETLSNICKASGGGVAVFKEDTLINWLMHETQTGENYKGALDNFTRSCAGYCVATCLLGIGDRHNDNIMLKRNGQFFHIDFGHILGHFKSKFGIKRERARFVLTPDMAFVMGGTHDPRFRSFEILCAQAFNQVRAEATKYLNLMSLMISSGLSEVSSPADVRYMHDIMLLNHSDEHAAKEFTKWIHDSLHTKSTQFNHAIHTWVHK